MKSQIILILGIISIIFVSGCISGTGNTISNLESGSLNSQKKCFTLIDADSEMRVFFEISMGSPKSRCDQACVDNGYLPGNHEYRDEGVYGKYYDCVCCEGDIESLGCTYATANLYIAGYDDVEPSERDCKEVCESHDFNVGSPEKTKMGYVYGWDCNCYKCVDEIKEAGFEKCYYDVIEEEISHCYYLNGTRINLQNS